MVVVGWWQGGEEAGVDEPEEEVRWGLWWWRGWVGPGVRVGRLLVVRVRVEVLVEGTRGVSPKRCLGSLVGVMVEVGVGVVVWCWQGRGVCGGGGAVGFW